MTSQNELAKRKAQLSDAKRRLLAKRLAGEASASAPARAAIAPRPSNAPTAASFAQERLWFLQQLAPTSVAYNMPSAMRLTGALDVAALHGALNAVVQRHEILRTTFAERDGQVFQQVAPSLTIELSLTDLQQAPNPIVDAERLAITEGRQPFDLVTGPLLRAALLRFTETDHLLLLTMHHIVTDEWSMGAFWRELAAHYRAQLAGASAALPTLPLQYADFAHWQRNQLESDQFAAQLAFWQRQLAHAPRLLQLPTDRPRPAIQRHEGALISQPLPARLAKALNQLSRQHETTMFATMLAAFYVLLHRYSHQHDLLVGTPIANRGHAELEGLIGFFLNTLVLRAQLQDGQTFVELLAQVKESTLAAFANQELPFERLVEALHPERDPSHNPLFQVMFVMQSDQAQGLDLPNLTPTPYRFDSGVSKFDLTLFVNQSNDQISSAIEYNSDLFHANTIQRMLGHWQVLLQGIVDNPTGPLSHLPLLTQAERQQILVEWNQTAVDFPHERCIHHFIEAQARQQPHAVAVIWQQQQLTYKTLNQRANRLARELQNAGVAPGAFVGLCVERSLEMVVGILAIHKAGGAYVALDPSYPSERLEFMLNDTQATVVLMQEKLAPNLPAHPARRIALDHIDWENAEWENIEWRNDELSATTDCQADNFVADVGPENPAYIIYTSGSTGRPKGVIVSHRNLVHSTTARFAYFEAMVERFLLLSSFAFDSSVVGIFWTLCQGGALVLPTQGDEQDAARLLNLIVRHKISHLLALPSLYDVLLEVQKDELSSLTAAIVAGEPCLPGLVDAHFKALPQTALYNEYGPTEGTVWSTVYQMHAADRRPSIPIGKPIPNMQVYILDAQRQPVPIGASGELYIGGEGITQGYLNQPELTAERFIDIQEFDFLDRSPSPTHQEYAEVSAPTAERERKFHGHDEGGASNSINVTGGYRKSPIVSPKLYRTGDLVRYLPDGHIEFLGRIDHQVKIRGFRIELGEIEQAITQHQGVDEAVVTVQAGDDGASRLAAYVTKHSLELTPMVLRSALKKRLPDYMMPSAIVILDELPRTPNGKIDRSRLPALADVQPGKDKTRTSPRDELEVQLAAIWTSVLKLAQVDIHDNYFALGGHSLQAMRLFHQIRQKMGRDLPLATLFQAPTIAEQANLLRREGWQPTWSSLTPIQPEGRKTPFFCMHAVGGNVLSLAALAAHLGPEQPFYALQSQGLDGKQTIAATVEEIAAYYLAEIRTVQPHGPYLLGGQSSGGLIAFEAARQLHEQGEKVTLLALFDSYAPPPKSNGAIHAAPAIPLTKRIAFHLQKLAQDGDSYLQIGLKRRVVRTRLGVKRVLENSLVRLAQSYYTKQNQPLPPRYRPIAVRTATENALRMYDPPLYNGPITLFRATQSIDAYLESIYGSQGGWSRLTSVGVSVHDIQGGHNLEREPQVGEVAAILKRLIG